MGKHVPMRHIADMIRKHHRQNKTGQQGQPQQRQQTPGLPPVKGDDIQLLPFQKRTYPETGHHAKAYHGNRSAGRCGH